RGVPAGGAAMSAAVPFDTLAPTYDATFTRSAVGTVLRRAVWRRLDAAFPAGSSVLELGCGTGEGAVHPASRGVSVHATDPSEAMLDVARAKAGAAGARVTFERLAAEDAGSLSATFDGAFSSFGALNCVADLSAVGRALAARLSPGAPLLVCLM